MSVKRNTIRFGAAAVALAIAIIAGSAFLANSSNIPGFGTGSPGGSSLLVIQLTDPPHVPTGTSSLNMTYTSLALLVGEPAGNGIVNPHTISVTPSGGSATLDLLKLQNVSQTIASASIPDGSVIYSVTFSVSSIKIDVNGTVSSVSLAGGSTFAVTLANDPSLHGTNLALLRLNPTVLNTSTGYQLIPSSVGVLRQSHGEGQDKVGSQHSLTSDDEHDLEAAQGSVSANLVSLSVSGNMTSVTFQVNNTGSTPVSLNAIGLHGNFTKQHGRASDHQEEVVFFPVVPASSSTTTVSTSTASTSTGAKSCAALQLGLANAHSEGDSNEGLLLNPGECVDLSFHGAIASGDSGSALIPSTGSGQVYEVHVIASDGANLQIDCTLPLGAASCVGDQSEQQLD
jgi:hypothetical protein